MNQSIFLNSGTLYTEDNQWKQCVSVSLFIWMSFAFFPIVSWYACFKYVINTLSLWRVNAWSGGSDIFAKQKQRFDKKLGTIHVCLQVF